MFTVNSELSVNRRTDKVIWRVLFIVIFVKCLAFEQTIHIHTTYVSPSIWCCIHADTRAQGRHHVRRRRRSSTPMDTLLSVSLHVIHEMV